jgi:hypothetical protein
MSTLRINESNNRFRHKDFLDRAWLQDEYKGFVLDEVCIEEYSSGICKTTYVYRRKD